MKKKKKDEFSLYHYSLPSEENYDYMGITYKTLGILSLNLNNLPRLPEEELLNSKKFIRALFYVRIGQTNFETIKEENIENDNNDNNNRRNSPETKNDDSQTMINIVITPGIHNFKYIEAKPYEYYFSNLTYNTSSLKKEVETKVYSMTCENPNHDILVIEISTCNGQYEINIQEELITKDNFNSKSIQYTENEYKGKKVIYIENIKSKHYYLSVRSKRSKFWCKIYALNDENCGNNLAYLFYYYTAFSEHFSFQEVDKWIIHQPYGSGKVKLDLPLIITHDIEMNKKAISDFKFDIFATKNKEYTKTMGSICFLSKVISNKSEIFKIDNVALLNNSSLILKDLDPGSSYYINILVQNMRTKELIAFHPIEVFTGGKSNIGRFIINLILLVLIIIILIYIYKYKHVKDELIFLRGDTLPKTDMEMENYRLDSKVQYTGLGSGY